MASVNFLFSKYKNQNKGTIYVRLNINRTTQLKKSTGIVINSQYWNNNTKTLKKNTDTIVYVKHLVELEKYILTCYQEDMRHKPIDLSWFGDILRKFSGISQEKDVLYNYGLHYIEKAKTIRNGKVLSPNTLKKYVATTKKIKDFDDYKNKKHLVREFTPSYVNEFVNYLSEVQKIGKNTIGSYISMLKTFCLDAREEGIFVDNSLYKIKGFSEEVPKHYLSFAEIEKIRTTPMPNQRLEDAKDWLIIGCYTGQRVSDLLRMNKEMIEEIEKGFFVLKLKQQKTQKMVHIPILPEVREILNKRNGDFPPLLRSKITDSAKILNVKIKEVCRLSKIDNIITAPIVDTKTRRKQIKTLPKYRFVSSHICRCSFATNF